MKVRIDLSRGVFKPRVETKYWVKKALKETEERFGQNKKVHILDLFAGSGFLGLLALKYFEKAVVDFADISKDAIEQIKINARANNIPKKRYRVLRSDIFSRIENKYNVILANPPYIALSRIREVAPDVLENEPSQALFAGKDGLDVIRKFLDQVDPHLKPGGLAFMEFDLDQKKAIAHILEKKQLSFDFKKDQFGQYRWLKCADNGLPA